MIFGNRGGASDISDWFGVRAVTGAIGVVRRKQRGLPQYGRFQMSYGRSGWMARKR